MSGATARRQAALAGLAGVILVLAGCVNDPSEGTDDVGPGDVMVEDDGGRDLGPDAALDMAAPDVAPPDMAELDAAPDATPPDMAEPDMAPDLGPDMAPDMNVGDLILTIDSPRDGDLVNQNPLPVSGSVSVAAAVTVNGVEAALDGLAWTASIPAADGELAIEVVAIGGGEEVVEGLTVTVDATPPALRILSPTDGSVVVTDPGVVDPTVEVCAEFEIDAVVAVMGVAVAVDEPGGGCARVPLPRIGANRIVATATDAAGNETRTEVFVTRREGVRDSDEDEDGLTLADEVERYGTDPTLSDTDGDGLGDGDEVLIHGTDPQNRDTDEDGLSDGVEVDEYGSDPTLFDTDGGGISDGQEVQFGTDPTDPNDDRVPLPITLIDGGGFEWDLSTRGNPADGTDDAFDTAQRLSLLDPETEAFVEWPGADGAAFEDDEREVRIGPVEFGDLVIDRKIYVPDDERFARFLELLSNPTANPIAVTVRVGGNLGSDGGAVLVATSNDVEGEPVELDATDDWLVSDDANEAGGDPVVSFVFSGADARIEPVQAAITNGTDTYVFDYEVVVPAGRTVGILTFAVQSEDRPMGIAQAERLVLHPIEAIEGMSVAEQLAVVNFRLLDDTDDDGLPDFRELELGTDPENPDTDGDGLTDLFEVDNGFDPLAPGEQGLDPDGDGLDNLAEQAAGTNPQSADPDMDGLDDPRELMLGTNPNAPDTDRDGLDDGREVDVVGTDPLVRDTDGGGRTDGEELDRDLTDPLDPTDDLAEPPVELIDGGGFLWDVLGDGSIDTGTLVDAGVTFDVGARLALGGTNVPPLDAARRRLGGREVVFGPSTVGDLRVVRQAYVPEDAQFARFVDVIGNPTDAPIETRATFTVDLAGFATEYVGDSDGDGTLTPADDWWLAFDAGFAGDRAVVGAIFSDADAATQPVEAEQSFSLIDWTFPVTVPAGGEIRLMHVLAQSAPGDANAARANLAALLARPDALFAGMTAEERLTVVNLDVALDSDGDGLADIEELALGTDPQNADSDGDGLLDGFEVANGFDPLTGGEQGLDPDGDGLDNLAEQDFGSDPNDPDADGDGLNDSGERAAGTDPFAADSDGDGLDDPRELDIGTDPNDPDTDGGGRLDGSEVDIDLSDPFDPADDRVPISLTHNLRDGADFLWDITRTGSISNGTRDTYDGGLNLRVGGQAFPGFDDGFLVFGAREALLGPAEMGGLSVSRRIYVPLDGQFARFTEVLTNPGDEDIAVEVAISGNLGSDGGTQLIDESSGDGRVDVADDWFVTDDGNLDGGDPTALHLFSDELAQVQPSAVTRNGDNFGYTFPVVVPAGETIFVMHFAAQHDNPADAEDNLAEIFPFGDVTLAGLRPEDRPRVVNLFTPLDDDGDGLGNDDEVLLGTDPANPDTDGDGLLDGYEVQNGFDPLVGGDGEADPDGDGLDNLGEVAARTDPNDPDTDGDGLDDGVEVAGPTDPRSPDSDGDGLLDGREIELGTDPLVADTDGGGTGDGDEVDRFGTDPLVGEDDILPVALPYSLFDGAGFEWDLNSVGASLDGSGDAYDTAFTMVVDGVPFPGQPDAVLQLGGQQLQFGPARMGDLLVTRRIYAATDGQFARYMETFTNTSGSAVDVVVNIGGNLGSDGDNVIIETSDGDQVVTDDDDWWTSDDGAIDLDPKLLFVISDEQAPVQPQAVDATRDNIDYDYPITVRPGETVHLMHFAAQADSREDIAAARDALLAFGPDTTFGLTGAELLAVQNLVVAEDADEDGLTDDDEVAQGTDPANPDTDGDGLLDGFEVTYGFDPLVGGEQGLDGDDDGLDNLAEQTNRTRPDVADTDGDGLSDGAEVALGTSPNSVDTDGDGLLDGDEPALGTDPTNPDTDGDGLTDGDELDRRIDPLDEDSDNDGALDGAEVAAGLDPRDGADAALDPDEDTVPSGVEANLGTDPFNPDTDGDGLDDGLEIDALGTDPLDPDTDGGGRSDGDEQLIDFTDPLDPLDDVPAVDLPVDLIDGAGFTWDVQRNGSLVDGTDDAYDAPTFQLQVGLDTFPGQDEAFTSDDRREIWLGPAAMGDLMVSRRIYVPVEGQFIRYVEVFENPTAAEVVVQVRITGDLGSDGSTDVIGDSSGDLLINAEDRWFATDDGAGEFTDPALGFACVGEGAAVSLASASVNDVDGRFSYGFDLAVPAGSRVALMHFAGQYADADSAIAGAEALGAPGEAELTGLEDEVRGAVQNFDVPPAD